MNNMIQQVPKTQSLMEAEQSKAIQEVQAALIIGKQFPRDIDQAEFRIVKACEQPALAEMAIYTYKKGNGMVTGASIRMAEMMAQNWGNLSFGIRELEQKNGESIVQAYCWDTETNVKQEKTFSVPHKRYTKTGSYALEDPRDIYEMVANNGARRLRSCILGVIPGYIQDVALKAVAKTLSGGTNGEPLITRIKSMLDMFSKEYKVSKEMIEKMINHTAESINETEMVKLKGVFRSLRDGIVTPDHFFEDLKTKIDDENVKNINDKMKKGNKKPVKQNQSQDYSPALVTALELIDIAESMAELNQSLELSPEFASTEESDIFQTAFDAKESEIKGKK